MRIRGILFVAGLLAVLGACRQDSEVFTPDPQAKQGLTTIVGQVVDANNEPIAGVDIRSGVILTQSDANGVFRLESVRTEDSKAYIRAIKDGFHHASRLHFSTDKQDNNIRIMMLEKIVEAQFDAATGGDVSLPNDVLLTFPADAIVTSGGANYAVMVDVNFAYLDPNDEYFSDKMPGNLIGMDTESIEQLLTSYGMLSVELEGSAGQSLNIREGSSVTIDAPVPDGLNPDNLQIPLWSFDELEGVWVEESVATVDVNRLRGDVTHFSWWNFDVPDPMVQVCFQLLLEDLQLFAGSTPAANTRGCITRAAGTSGKQKVCGSSDDNGEFKARVPVGEEMTLEILDPCGSVIFTTTIGPYTEDTTEDPITIPDTEVNNLIVTGTLVNCAGERVQNGYIVYHLGDASQAIINYVDDGIISDTLLRCNDDNFTVYGVDIDNISQTTTGTYTAADMVNIGEIIACEEVQEFVKIDYQFMSDDQSDLFTEILHSMLDDGVTNKINQGNGQDSIGFLEFSFLGSMPGVTDMNANFFSGSDFQTNQVSCEGNVEVTITSYGAIGEYIEGTLSATDCFIAQGRDNENGPVTGSFRVIRKE